MKHQPRLFKPTFFSLALALLLPAGAIFAAGGFVAGVTPSPTATKEIFVTLGVGGNHEVRPQATNLVELEVGQIALVHFGLINNGVTSQVLYNYDWVTSITNNTLADVNGGFVESTTGFDTPSGPDTFDFTGGLPNPIGWHAASTNNTNGGICGPTPEPSQPLMGPQEGVELYGVYFEAVTPGDYIIDTTSLVAKACVEGVVIPLQITQGDNTIIRITAPVVATSIPTLSQWGMMILAMLLSIGAFSYTRGRKSA